MEIWWIFRHPIAGFIITREPWPEPYINAIGPYWTYAEAERMLNKWTK